jgi:hypothetical protein
MKYKPAFWLGLVMLYCVICAMSRCEKEDITPQAETVIEGLIKDPRTGEPVSNVKLIIEKSWGGTLYGRGYKNYDSLYTQADGSYYLKFIPLGIGDYIIRFDDLYGKYFNYSYKNAIEIGKINRLNFTFQKAVQVTVNLHNSSSQNRKQFRLYTDSCCQSTYHSTRAMYGTTEFAPVIKDTALKYAVPQLSNIRISSLYHNGYTNSSGLTDTLWLRKSFIIGRKDTIIHIQNP